MAHVRFLAMALVGSVAIVAAPRPAIAQCRLCSAPTTAIPESGAGDDLKLEIETRLNFDRLILYGQNDGTAVIRPDGSTAVSGAVTGVGPRANVGTIVIHGQPGRAVRVDIPRRIQLFSLSGGQMSFDELETDLPSSPRLDSAGNLSFRFGGRVRVTGDSDGDYRGDLNISVDYQ